MDMRERKIAPNVITFSTMIRGFCRKGDVPAALTCLDELYRERPRLKPDEIVYNTLLEGCAKANLVTEAERIFSEMQREGLRPSSYTLTVIVKLLGQARCSGRSVELVDEVTAKWRVKPTP